jgi:hypothetical protein
VSFVPLFSVPVWLNKTDIPDFGVVFVDKNLKLKWIFLLKKSFAKNYVTFLNWHQFNFLKPVVSKISGASSQPTFKRRSSVTTTPTLRNLVDSFPAKIDWCRRKSVRWRCPPTNRAWPQSLITNEHRRVIILIRFFFKFWQSSTRQNAMPTNLTPPKVCLPNVGLWWISLANCHLKDCLLAESWKGNDF